MKENKEKKSPSKSIRRSILDTTAIMGLCTITSFLMFKTGLHPMSELLVFVLGLIPIAKNTPGYLYTSISGIASILLVNFLYIKPYHSFRMDPMYFMSFVIMLLIAVSLSYLMEGQRALMAQKLAIEEEARKESFQASMLRSLSHDIRTPLAGLSGSADVLINVGDSLSEEKKKEIYTYLAEETQWLTDFVDNLLSISRLSSGQEAVNAKPEILSDIINESLKHVDRRINKYKIITRYDDELSLVTADARLVSQVVINIVNNAIRYTPDGSTIEIRTRDIGDMLEVRLADNGKGINDEAKSHIFEKFFTTGKLKEDSRRGMGLGLSLCKTIIESHEGEIRVEDNVPHGAVFVFTLPKAELSDLSAFMEEANN